LTGLQLIGWKWLAKGQRGHRRTVTPFWAYMAAASRGAGIETTPSPLNFSVSENFFLSENFGPKRQNIRVKVNLYFGDILGQI